MDRLKDKVAIVTGGSSGIGRAIALMFAEEGAAVNVFARHPISGLPDEEPGDIGEELQKRVGGGRFHKVDLTKREDVERGVQAVLDEYGRIDILVNNAGVFIRNSITDVSDEEWDRVFDLNIKSYLYTCRAVIPHMVERKYGKIVNMASIHGIFGTGKATTYCATKGAIVNLTKQLAVDYAKDGLLINSISPGTTRTAMCKPFLDTPENYEEYCRRTMLPYLGMPKDVAYGAVYLASDESNFVHSHNLVIDGGWTSW